MRVLGDRVLVRPTPIATMTASGLALPDRYVPEVSGTVVALGDGPRAEDGTLLPHRVNVNDEVIFSAESGHDVVLEDARFIVLREEDLLAVFV